MVLVLPLLLGCRELGLVEGTPRERYERALERAHLSTTALGEQWFEAGRNAVARPVTVTLPFRETGFFPAERALAAGFTFTAERGQRMTVNLSAASTEPAQLFLDLFSAIEPDVVPELLVSADSGETGFDLEIEETGRYLVRIQPELLRGVRYTLTIRTGPSLGFPVTGVDNDAIKSRWGADRDGGRRLHEGIDIFAPRGTPVVAATRGRIVNVGDNRLGGLVVWLHDSERNQNLYYAHLDRQVAREGEEVEPGDTLGFVGNTGNARTTPPHLHFGIYRRGEGAIDPYPFVWRAPDQPPGIDADTTRLGEWVRIAATRAVLTGGTPERDTLPRATVMRVMAVSGDRFRVELPDHRNAYVGERSIQSANAPSGQNLLDNGARILERPVPGAVAVAVMESRSNVGVLGEFGDYLLVRTTKGETGWIKSR